MEDDGGLSRARAEIELSKSIDDEKEQRERDAVGAVLDEQGDRVQKAVKAFLSETKRNGIEPERIFMGMRVTGPPPRHTHIPPEEEVYESGFVLLRFETHRHESFAVHMVVVFESGEIELLRHQGYSSLVEREGHADREGALPFHLPGPTPGSVPAGDLERKVTQVSRTTDWFVGLLAKYLDTKS